MAGKRPRQLTNTTTLPAGAGVPVDAAGETACSFVPVAHLSRAGRTLVVDNVYGDDDTAARGKPNAPYLTPAAAQAAAQSGDLIVVLPGDYTLSAALGKDGVNWWLWPGVTLTAAPQASVYAAASAMTYSVGGCGTLETPASNGGAAVISVSHASAAVVVEADSVAAESGDSSGAAASVAAGSLTVRRARLSTAGDGGAVAHSGGTTRLDWCEVRNAAGPSATVSGAGLTVQGGVLVGVGASIYAASAVNVKLYGTVAANVAKDNNVTLLCGTLDVDTDVT